MAAPLKPKIESRRTATWRTFHRPGSSTTRPRKRSRRRSPTPSDVFDATK